MSLFPESQKKAGAPASGANALHLIVQFDGGSRGNPGPAGIGVTLTTEKDEPVYELAEFLGTCTNNVAEYTGFLRGLTAAVALGAKKVTVRSDSELLVRQINGIYKVKSPDLKPLYEKAVSLIRQLGDVKVQHVYRESNSRADELANMAMDTRKKIEPLGPPGTVAPGKALGGSSVPRRDSKPEFPILHFPEKFDEQEAESRGFLAGAQVELADGSRHDVYFANASRLAYDLEDGTRKGHPFVARKGLIVLQSVTRANMSNAILALADAGHFDE